MRKFRTLALLATVGTIGSVFAAGWTFLELTGDPVKKEAIVTGTIADAESVDIALVGSWAVSSNNLSVNYSNPDVDNNGYAVEATVTLAATVWVCPLVNGWLFTVNVPPVTLIVKTSPAWIVAPVFNVVLPFLTVTTVPSACVIVKE